VRGKVTHLEKLLPVSAGGIPDAPEPSPGTLRTSDPAGAGGGSAAGQPSLAIESCDAELHVEIFGGDALDLPDVR
jgi:hypothetical protein